jgi:hypothetical protein
VHSFAGTSVLSSSPHTHVASGSDPSGQAPHPAAENAKEKVMVTALKERLSIEIPPRVCTSVVYARASTILPSIRILELRISVAFRERN